MATDRARERVGRKIAERREQYVKIGKEEASRRAGISPITWLKAERGERVTGATLAKMDSALELEPGTLAAWIEGDIEEPAPADPIIARIEQRHAEHAITDQDRDVLIAARRAQIERQWEEIEQLQHALRAARESL